MYRVRISIQEVHIGLFGTPQLYLRFVIKKATQNLNLPKKYLLADGIAKINDQFQFYIDVEKCSFTLSVVMEKKDSNVMKFAGSVKIDLKEKNIGKEEAETLTLQNCPDKDASISMSLVFEPENTVQMIKPIQSSQEVDRRIYLKDIKELREKLISTEQNMKKNAEEYGQKSIEKGKMIEKLQLQAKNTKQKTNQQIQELQKSLEEKQQAVEQYSKELMQSKKKLADVIDALNEVGDGSVLEKIENLLND